MFLIHNVIFCLWCNWAHQGDRLSLDAAFSGGTQLWGFAAPQHLKSYSKSKAQIFLIFMLQVTKVSPIPLGSLLLPPYHGRGGSCCQIAIRAFLPALPHAFATSSFFIARSLASTTMPPGGSCRCAKSQRAGITLLYWPLQLGDSHLYCVPRA